jgi:hypothetical protein
MASIANMFAVENPVIEFMREDVYEQLGLKTRGQIHHRIKRLVPEVIDNVKALELIKPAYSYKVIDIKKRKLNRVYLQDGWEIASPLLVHRLAGASQLVVGAFTIGQALSEQVSACFAEGNYSRAMILDAIGNSTLFRLCELFEGICETEATERGICSSGTLSPGDEGFGLESQKTLLAIAEADRCGIKLLESDLMLPIRSISMVAGLGKRVKKWSRSESCANCSSKERCKLRKLDA